MIYIINRVSWIIYLLILLIVIFYAGVSLSSYYSVLNDFGRVPLSNDYATEVIGLSGKSLKIFPQDVGYYLIISFYYSVIVTLFLIPGLLFMKYFNNRIKVHSKLAVVLIITISAVYILGSFSTAMGWYTGYVLD